MGQVLESEVTHSLPRTRDIAEALQIERLGKLSVATLDQTVSAL